MRFFGFAERKPLVVYNLRGTQLIWITWWLTRLAHYRRTWNSPNFVEVARPLSPQVSTVAPFLLDCSGLLPIPGHVIGVSRRHRRGSEVRRFGAKETQPISQLCEPTLYALVYGVTDLSDKTNTQLSNHHHTRTEVHN